MHRNRSRVTWFCSNASRDALSAPDEANPTRIQVHALVPTSAARALANRNKPVSPPLSYFAARQEGRALQFSGEAPAPRFQRFERDSGIDIASDAGISDDLDHLLAVDCRKSGDFHSGNSVTAHSASSLAKVTQYFLRDDDKRYEALEDKLLAFVNKNAPQILGLIVHFGFLRLTNLSVGDERRQGTSSKSRWQEDEMSVGKGADDWTGARWKLRRG